MADYTTLKLPDARVKFHPVDAMLVHLTYTIPASGPASGDNIVLMTIPANYVVVHYMQALSGTIGASATLTAKVGSTSIAAATTAGGADTKVQSLMDVPSASARNLQLTVGGANVAASATVTVQFLLVPAWQN
jgi:hypothetical protein